MLKNKITIILFVAALLIQVGILLSFQAAKETTIQTGKKIIVETVPVDPRSLFRGDYVILNYDFSRINRVLVDEKLHRKLKRGTKLYVKLEGKPIPSDKQLLLEEEVTEQEWKVTAISDRVFKNLQSNEIMLVGHTGSFSDSRISIKYGIESYFVPEGKGLAIEKKMGRASIKVMLAVDRKGEAVVMKLFIDGQEVRFDETEKKDEADETEPAQ